MLLSRFTKVSANDGMPCWVVLFVKLLFDEGSYVLLDIVLFQRLQTVIRSHHS